MSGPIEDTESEPGIPPKGFMIKAHRITRDNLEALRGIYGRFCEKAVPEYQWAREPVGFEDLGLAIAERVLFGYWVEDTAVTEPIALMLYRQEAHRALEINVIHVEIDDLKTVLDRLMRMFIEDNRERPGWEVVSYAMLGRQAALIRTITWYGFKPVGQAVLNMDLTDAISIQIFQQQQFALPGAEYTLDCWQPQYAGAVAECIHAAFEKATDGLWDPRFKSLTGTRQVVGLITADGMGQFLPACTSILLKNNQPVGFCFLIEDSLMQAHIPLIGLHPDEKRQNLGNALLKDCLSRTIAEMVAGHNSILKVNATTDTDNIRAIKMYRRMGFKEIDNYPHVYLTREKLLAFQPGKWC
ncbi:GNAT family N-acetyltransferase [Vampirovibrio sp.]|uniref:GNAT family N-acetyltransferase n=1 Tax=Vampirovibrio sp. TaxID=2717857 RepID=UPI003593C433